MKKIAFIITLFLSLYITDIKAQATVGAGRPPHDGAILEIVSSDTKGLILPKVILSSEAAWGPIGGNKADGMVVFNTNTSVANGLKGKGVYMWYRNKWNMLNKSRT